MPTITLSDQGVGRMVKYPIFFFSNGYILCIVSIRRLVFKFFSFIPSLEYGYGDDDVVWVKFKDRFWPALVSASSLSFSDIFNASFN